MPIEGNKIEHLRSRRTPEQKSNKQIFNPYIPGHLSYIMHFGCKLPWIFYSFAYKVLKQKKMRLIVKSMFYTFIRLQDSQTQALPADIFSTFYTFICLQGSQTSNLILRLSPNLYILAYVARILLLSFIIIIQNRCNIAIY